MITLQELRDTTPMFPGSVKEMIDAAYKWTRTCLCPLMSGPVNEDDILGAKGEILIKDERGRFNHIYFYHGGHCEVWNISNTQAVEWANRTSPMPPAWPHDEASKRRRAHLH